MLSPVTRKGKQCFKVKYQSLGLHHQKCIKSCTRATEGRLWKERDLYAGISNPKQRGARQAPSEPELVCVCVCGGEQASCPWDILYPITHRCHRRWLIIGGLALKNQTLLKTIDKKKKTDLLLSWLHGLSSHVTGHVCTSAQTDRRWLKNSQWAGLVFGQRGPVVKSWHLGWNTLWMLAVGCLSVDDDAITLRLQPVASPRPITPINVSQRRLLWGAESKPQHG